MLTAYLTQREKELYRPPGPASEPGPFSTPMCTNRDAGACPLRVHAQAVYSQWPTLCTALRSLHNRMGKSMVMPSAVKYNLAMRMNKRQLGAPTWVNRACYVLNWEGGHKRELTV